jgi:F-box/TPR repeat protein Pof3
MRPKMDNADAALKDAKAMIRLDRTDARGYIRYAQSVRSNDKQAALDILEHGSKNVVSSDPNLAFLKRDMNNISASIATERTLSRARDPIASLPLEIVGQVLSYVEHRQIVRMLRVCRSWKNLLSQLPPLTEVVAFPQTKKPITPKMLLACLRRLKNPKVVDISWLPPPSREILYGRLKRQTEFNSLVSASCALLA